MRAADRKFKPALWCSLFRRTGLMVSSVLPHKARSSSNYFYQDSAAVPKDELAHNDLPPHSHSIVSRLRNLLLHQDFSREGCDFTVSPTDDLRRLTPSRTDRSRRVGGDSHERHPRNAR